MYEKETEKYIGYALACIIAYYVLQMILPMLVWSIVGLLVIRIIQEHQKRK